MSDKDKIIKLFVIEEELSSFLKQKLIISNPVSKNKLISTYKIRSSIAKDKNDIVREKKFKEFVDNLERFKTKDDEVVIVYFDIEEKIYYYLDKDFSKIICSLGRMDNKQNDNGPD